MGGWWRRRSLRARLTVAATVAITVVTAGAAALLVWRVHASLVSQLDATVTREALSVAAAVRSTSGQPTLPRQLTGEYVVQIVDRSGQVVASSPNIEGEPRLFTFPAPEPLGSVTIRTARVPVGEEGGYRVAATPTGGSDSLLVYAGRSLEPTTRSVTEFGLGLAVGVPVLAAALGGITWLLVGRALRPVEVLRSQAAEITVTDLHRRVDVPPAADELARLAATLNELLSRLDTSLTQQRRFIADAAHELRSPITSLSLQLEVAEQGGGGATPAELIPEVRRLSELVDNLLTLASLDAAPSPRLVPVDLDDLVFTEVQRPRPRGDVVVDLSGVSAAGVRGDAVMLTRVVRNLLDNAFRHAAGRIVIQLHSGPSTATLTVADDGPGIPEDQRAAVFDRFTRLDEARARDAGGRGLGLAIVRDVVSAHHGTVTVDDNRPGARFTVQLPVDESLAP